MSTRDEPIGALEDWTALLDDVEEPPAAAPVSPPSQPRRSAKRMEADGSLLAEFIDALFRYADEGTFVSLRAFYDDRDGVFGIRPACLSGGLEPLLAAAGRFAMDCASAPARVVFAPPVATFDNEKRADEASLANGLALSVECDRAPGPARLRLESLLGTATVVVESGGEWLDEATGEPQRKLHLHWRLAEPTRDPDAHAQLKEARALATALVGGDPSNKPAVHPIRWPGSWHRKGAPRLATIASLHPDTEIELSDALELLREAATAAGVGGSSPKASLEAASAPLSGEERDTAELVRAVVGGEDYHGPVAALAMRFLKGGVPDAQAVLLLRGIMRAVPEPLRDLKDGQAEAGRWRARYDDIPRAVSTARSKLAAGEGACDPDAWPEPLDFLAEAELTGVPELRAEHLPDALASFVFDTAPRMGVDPAAVALAALVSCASVASDEWAIQPKRRDTSWTENPRLWGAIVGDPSIRKTPVLRACTRPIDALEAEARERHDKAMTQHKAAVAEAKAKAGGGDPADLPPAPVLQRYMVESATTEALSEVLRGDAEAKQKAPAGKVLVRQDEMGEFFGNLDRYSGGRGGGDRGAYLRLYNGGRFTIDRVNRGSFAVLSWSACFLGGIQPGPIQRIARETADDGLLQRFCYCVPARQWAGEDREPDRAALARYEALFPALAALRPAPPGEKAGPVVLHSEAHRYREEADRVAAAVLAVPDTSDRLKAALGKWAGLFARIALTFHLIDIADAGARDVDGPDPAVLPEETARRTLAYMREVLLPHLLRAEAVMFSTAQTGHARWIAGWILSRGQARVALRDVVQAYRALRAPEHKRELLDVMEALVTAGWLRPEPQPNPARPPAAWTVNPAVHSSFAARGEQERQERARVRREIVAAVGGRKRKERGIAVAVRRQKGSR